MRSTEEDGEQRGSWKAHDMLTGAHPHCRSQLPTQFTGFASALKPTCRILTHQAHRALVGRYVRCRTITCMCNGSVSTHLAAAGGGAHVVAGS